MFQEPQTFKKKKNFSKYLSSALPSFESQTFTTLVFRPSVPGKYKSFISLAPRSRPNPCRCENAKATSTNSRLVNLSRNRFLCASGTLKASKGGCRHRNLKPTRPLTKEDFLSCAVSMLSTVPDAENRSSVACHVTGPRSPSPMSVGQRLCNRPRQHAPVHRMLSLQLLPPIIFEMILDGGDMFFAVIRKDA